MFPLLSLSGTLKSWQEKYCDGDYAVCERYKRSQLGKPVPPDMLPNGVLLGDHRGGSR